MVTMKTTDQTQSLDLYGREAPSVIMLHHQITPLSYCTSKTETTL